MPVPLLSGSPEHYHDHDSEETRKELEKREGEGADVVRVVPDGE